MKIQVFFLSIYLIMQSYTCMQAQYFRTLYGHSAQAGILDGERKSFMVTGYSTSNWPRIEESWPSVLQDMLHQHAGNYSTYYVFRHSIDGAALVYWTGICEDRGYTQDGLTCYVNPGTRVPAHAPKASIMLAQQTLQWAFGNCNDPFIGITSQEDWDAIATGAEAIASYTLPFIQGGIEQVYMATHIYKTGPYPQGLCGEKYALERAINRVAHLHPGPELCEITQSMYPWGFDIDGIHPDTEVAHAMALYWYLVLAGEDANLSIAQSVANIANIEVPENTLSRLDRAYAL